LLAPFWFSLGSLWCWFSLVQFGFMCCFVGSVLVQCWLSWVQFWVSWFSVGSVLVASGSAGEMLAQFGSWLVLLVQFRFGEVSVHVEDYVRAVQFVSVLVLVDQCWFWFGSVWFRLFHGWSNFCFSLGGSVLAQFWFRFVHFGLNFGSVSV